MPRTSSRKDYLRWKNGADVGCVFARYMARKPDDHGQRFAISLSSTPATAARRIDTFVSECIDEPEAAVATIVLPSVKEFETLVRLAEELAKKSGWLVHSRLLTVVPRAAVVAFAVSRSVSLATGRQVPSEALVLGPFDAFPNTRKSPVTAFEIFTGTPPEVDKDGNKTVKANLADARLDDMPNQNTFDNMWEATRKARDKSLNGIKDTRAKAKVSFVVPLKLARSMGYAR